MILYFYEVYFATKHDHLLKRDIKSWTNFELKLIYARINKVQFKWKLFPINWRLSSFQDDEKHVFIDQIS